ncbi:MAG: hypothetical protein ACK41C_08505 [Phenylobacterium sp.]|jgi:hypothetical protein|uniref:hypothetical protein n=1 Tax=Phenylobacterium sp. TaxID=1871053 RepID=UPI00391B7D94
MFRSVFARTPSWVLALLLLLAGGLIGFLGRASGLNQGPIGAAVLTAAMILVVGPIAIVYWRRLDEAQREAHKFAWYWGGSAGIVVVLLGFIALSSPGAQGFPADFLGAEEPRDLFAFGMVATLMAQVIGYFVAWIGWWIARR